MRCIDADALVKKINLAIATLKRTMKNFDIEDDPECQMELKTYRDIRDGIKGEPTIEPEQRWVPCSKKLPKKDGDYWVTTKSGQIARFLYIKGLSDDYWNRCATAWMPLPKPYREEGHENT